MATRRAKKERPPRQARALSAQESCFESMENHRLFECAEAKIETVEASPPGWMINRLITTAIGLCGFTELSTAAGVATPFDQLIRLYDFFTSGDFGRDRGWPVMLFLSPNVLRRTLEDREVAEAA